MRRTFFADDLIIDRSQIFALHDFLQLTFIIHHMRKSTFFNFRKHIRVQKVDNFVKPLIQIQRTENRMSKKIHDELANGIYQVMDQVQLDPQQEAVGNQLYTLYTRARDLSRDYAPIDTTTDYSQTLEQLLSQYKGLKTKLILSGLQETPWGRLSTFQKETLYRVLQELMVNMKKHSAATMVALRFEANPKYLIIQYTDNGKGADFINAKRGLGLAHVENRMENIKGQITFESKPGEGFVARINIPI